MMNINKKDITFDYSQKGYNIYYKGHLIGGAGISRHNNGRKSNIILFKQAAENDIENIINNCINTRYYKEIIKYNEV